MNEVENEKLGGNSRPIKEQSEKKENILRRMSFSLNIIFLVQSNLYTDTEGNKEQKCPYYRGTPKHDTGVFLVGVIIDITHTFAGPVAVALN